MYGQTLPCEPQAKAVVEDEFIIFKAAREIKQAVPALARLL